MKTQGLLGLKQTAEGAALAEWGSRVNPRGSIPKKPPSSIAAAAAAASEADDVKDCLKSYNDNTPPLQPPDRRNAGRMLRL